MGREARVRNPRIILKAGMRFVDCNDFSYHYTLLRQDLSGSRWAIRIGKGPSDRRPYEIFWSREFLRAQIASGEILPESVLVMEGL